MYKTISYRPEIDGLRTVAVLSVVVYHAEISIFGRAIFPGGFLGVDVFFVISGYLISSIIIKSLKANSFSIAEFYERRARRILPVLLTVLLLSIPFAWVTLFKREMTEYSDSILGTLFFYSNHVFVVDEYWALNAKYKPLLHTWSLAVEEQFYVLTPLLLITLYRHARGHMLLVVCAIAFASLLFAEWGSSKLPVHTFYILPSRMWELFAGVSLAIIQPRDERSHQGRFSIYLPAVGAVLVLGSMMLFTETTRHPSMFTAIPVIGTVLLIRYANSRDLVTRVLSIAPFVGIGKISYGLYLWHFPIFVFARLGAPELWQNHRYLLVLLSILIATLTYFTIEQPFRNKKKIPLITIFLPCIFIAYTLLVVFTVFANKYQGFEGRLGAHFPNFIANNIEYENVFLQKKSWELKNSEFATFEKGEGKTRVLLIGHSHVKDLFNAFELNSHRYPHIDFAYQVFRCRFGADSFFGSNEYKMAEYVIIIQSQGCTARHAVQKQSRGKKMIYVSRHIRFKTQTIDEDDPKSRYLRIGKSGGLTLIDQKLMQSGDIDKSALEKDAFENSNYFKVKAESTPVDGVSRYIDLNPLQCDEFRSTCLILTPEGKKMYYDAAHWTMAGARYMGELIAEHQLLERAMR